MPKQMTPREALESMLSAAEAVADDQGISLIAALVEVERGSISAGRKAWKDAQREGLDREAALQDRVEVLEAALQKIARWHGEFPETGKFWDKQKTEPMTYGAAYGSNGERDFMRQVAFNALNPDLLK